MKKELVNYISLNIFFILISCAPHDSAPLNSQENKVPDKTTTPEKSEKNVTLKTKSGAVFVLDTSNPALGEAWRDPSGVIWGDVAKNQDQTTMLMDSYSAEKYCRTLGARIPDVDEVERLGRYFGSKPNSLDGYEPQVLPNPNENFWSSIVYPQSWAAWVFSWQYGQNYGPYRRDQLFAVRCVSLIPKKESLSSGESPINKLSQSAINTTFEVTSRGPNSAFVLTIDIGDYIAKDSSSQKYCQDYWAKDGDACEITQHDAVKYCELQGKHLPSAREYAEYAMGRGATGIRETNFPNTPVRGVDRRVMDEWTQMGELGYTGIHHYIGGSLKEDGMYFYYSEAKYKPFLPKTCMRVWTSTFAPGQGIYYFDLDSGSLSISSSSGGTLYARCAPGPL